MSIFVERAGKEIREGLVELAKAMPCKHQFGKPEILEMPDISSVYVVQECKICGMLRQIA